MKPSATALSLTPIWPYFIAHVSFRRNFAALLVTFLAACGLRCAGPNSMNTPQQVSPTDDRRKDSTEFFGSSFKPGAEPVEHLQSAHLHWPEYGMEAALLGLFMISACVLTVSLIPGLPVRAAIPSAFVRRMLTGISMGLTAIALIYSPGGSDRARNFNPRSP